MPGELSQKIEDDLKSALKAGESLKVSTLRMSQNAIHNKAIQLLKKETGLSDEETAEVLKGEAKKRKDAAQEFHKAGRDDLADKENDELKIIQAYLPAEISDAELERILKEGIRETGASGEKDFGKVMKSSMPILKGKASGDRISTLLKKLLIN
ncbi:GatB/YqeY domain-containing protein [Candidatus Giovannonibacteria bacterium]|nr:GatB/YqeY domain-containing protein [Candidatus Giovannonibacteria bacterium]